jgi:hypothetical protein
MKEPGRKTARQTLENNFEGKKRKKNQKMM